MTPKPHLVLEMCINHGIDYGWNLAHKHTDTPNENMIKREVEKAILHNVYEWFDMEEEKLNCMPLATTLRLSTKRIQNTRH